MTDKPVEAPSSEQRKALERFVVGNELLDSIEAQIGQFNLFEAVGAVRSELRHSDFLAFLLDPSSNHGLSDFLLKEFLKDAVSSTDQHDVSAIEIDTANLSDADVRREWESIDILIRCPTAGIVCAIENKVDSTERVGQTGDYRKIVEREFSAEKHVFILLSPEKVSAQDNRWSSYGYGELATVIDRVVSLRSSVMGQDIAHVMSHYTTMLRRHIVSDSEIAKLCGLIYERHRLALDLIFEYRPDSQLEISKLCRDLVQRSSTLLVSDTESKSLVRFGARKWDESPVQKQEGTNWTQSGRLLLFEWSNGANFLELKLIVGPGNPDVRQRLFDASLARPKLFVNNVGKLYPKFTQIYRRRFLSKRDYEDKDLAGLQAKVSDVWEKFESDELTELIEVMSTALGEA